MKANEVALAKLLGGQQQFQIPLYQRTYSWTDAQLKQLWRDILDQVRQQEPGTAGQTHFIGSVVLAPSPASDVTFSHWLVVDGQQRLTTLSIALMAIRDHLGQSDQRQVERINEQYLTNKWKEGDAYLRLLPTQADRESYYQHVTGTHSAHDLSKVAATYRFFQRALTAALDTADRYDVARIEQAIAGRLSIVAITADHDDNVYRIFESLNNTGLKLSQADLVRNYLFMRMPTRGEHVYRTYWLPMQRSLTNDELEDLMWLDLVAANPRVRRQDVYSARQAAFEAADSSEPAIEEYVRELHRCAAHLRLIVGKKLDTDAAADPRIEEHLERLRMWRGRTAYPVVMFLLDRQAKGELSTDDVVRALSYIESFLVRRAICDVPTQGLNRIFQDLPNQLPLDVSIADGIHRALSAERRFWPGDEQLQEAVRTKPFYWQGTWDQRRLILQRLEEERGHSEPVDYAKAKLTIEHVLPQQPSADWFTVLAAEAVGGETPEALHARIVHTLGNLTLTAENGHLSNHPFDRKQQLLAKSHLELNREIATSAQWGAREIAERGARLAGRAVQIWPAPLPGVGRIEQGRDWRRMHEALAELPAGTWTTYGDLAALIGSAAVAVGAHLSATSGVVNAHRVLDSTGRLALGFRWPDPGDSREVRDVLAAEGVRLDPVTGRADAAQRLDAQDLADLLGLTGEEFRRRGGAEERQADELFQAQLAEHNPEPVVQAVRQVLEFWEKLDGGYLLYGVDTSIGCIPMLDRPGTDGIWPVALYPAGSAGGRVEVVFRYLTRREPFAEVELREQLRIKLNALPGVAIPDGKIALRPSFPMAVLADDDALDLFCSILEWFRTKVRESIAAAEPDAE